MAWLQPLPDALVAPESEHPPAIVATREGVRLALRASLQFLPRRQRAALILCEVLKFPASEIATMLDTTVPAVKSFRVKPVERWLLPEKTRRCSWRCTPSPEPARTTSPTHTARTLTCRAA